MIKNIKSKHDQACQTLPDHMLKVYLKQGSSLYISCHMKKTECFFFKFVLYTGNLKCIPGGWQTNTGDHIIF